MTTPAIVEVGFYAPNGRSRNLNPDIVLTGVSWELLEAGGMGRATIPLAVPFEQARLVTQEGDTVRIWVNNILRFVGTVSEPQRNLDLVENCSFTCYGEMERMNHIRAQVKIVRQGGADLSVFANILFDIYEQKTGLAFDRDVQDTGVFLETLDATGTEREALDTLISQGPGVVVWGWEVTDPTSGGTHELTAYLRPRVATVGWQPDVGDGNVKAVSESRSLADVGNVAKPLKGGKARFPNRTATVVQDADGNPNTGFERPQLPDPVNDSLLPNTSFENQALGGGLTTWTEGAGATDGTAAAHSGSRSVQLPPGGYIESDTAFTNPPSVARFRPVPGHTYQVGFWGRKVSAAGAPIPVTQTFEWLDSGGSTLASITPLVASLDATAFTSYPVNAVIQTTAPAGTTGFRMRLENTGSSGDVYVDDPFLLDVGILTQPGWNYTAEGSGAVVDVVPSYNLDAHSGAYSFYLEGTASDPDTNRVLLQLNQDVPVTGSESVVIGIWLMSPALTTSGAAVTTVPDIRLIAIPLKADGSAFVSGLIPVVWTADLAGGAALTTWTFLYMIQALPSDCATVRIKLALASNGAILYDDLLLRNSYIFAGQDTEYIPGDVWQRDVAVDDPALTGLSTAAAASIASYGRREVEVSNEQLIEWNDRSKAWITGWLNKNAVTTVRPRIEIDHDAESVITPATGLTLRLSGLNEVFGDDWPTTVTYTAGAADKLSISVETGDPEPTLAREIANGLTPYTRRY